MRKGNPLHLRGEESVGFPLQVGGRNAEVGAVDTAGDSPDREVSRLAEGA